MGFIKMNEPEFFKLMDFIITNFNIENILEIGTLLGETTFFCSDFDKVKQVTTVDFKEHPRYIVNYKFFLSNLSKHKNKNKILHYDEGSNKFFETCDKTYDLIFIDGDHGYTQSKSDLQNSIKHLRKGGIILMHDINDFVKRTEEKSCKNVFLEFNDKGYIKTLAYIRTTDGRARDGLNPCGVIIKL